MGKESKIVGSQFQTYINTELRKGTPLRTLESDLKQMGFDISHSALYSYKQKNEIKEDEKVIPEQVKPVIVPIEPSNEKNTTIMQQSFRNALVIANQRLVEHSEGECKFPTEELKGLKLLDDIMKSNEVDRSGKES